MLLQLLNKWTSFKILMSCSFALRVCLCLHVLQLRMLESGPFLPVLIFRRESQLASCRLSGCLYFVERVLVQNSSEMLHKLMGASAVRRSALDRPDMLECNVATKVSLQSMFPRPCCNRAIFRNRHGAEVQMPGLGDESPFR